MTTRRSFLKLTALAGTGTYLARKLDLWPRVFGQVPGGTLSPTDIAKFAMPLFIPPAMPVSRRDNATDYYTIGVRQFEQQILPPRHPRTTIFGYGSLTDARSFSCPACTIEARAQRPARVKWVNQLMDADGAYLPHLLPVDQTLHWANPPAGLTGRDMNGTDPSPYRGPVPFITHVHGGHTPDESANPLRWMQPVTENPVPGATEIWELHNFTEDAHPIHVHLVQFEIVERVDVQGVARRPEAWETGTKDTLIAYPGEITRLKATFDREGQYTYHCHIWSTRTTR